ncbi:sulfotransferase family protein [Anthocerotibacter panamensis]|uniref:sulfotransferase family protein n=1 Tax=Anthocerotibacter panamensis TaxID=2857077 RepID=UPI001C4048CF|nr:sulfotransferase [Anthocerotibacter panamensis]
MTSELLIILSPPRSFSSVVSTMIGQHPDLYGFPELHLFVADTIQGVMEHHAHRGRPQGPPGLLRTLAQLHDKTQTIATIAKARLWLSERGDWSTKKLYDYLLELIHPKIGVEKSPVTVTTKEFIERAYQYYPQASYLHLIRHPVSARKSMLEFVDRKGKSSKVEPITGLPIDPIRLWYNTHLNITNFINSLPTGQSMRVKGEDILSDPDLYLPQISEWLGIRTDKAAIEAMKHPEDSPYACVGPYPARGGNDGKFMMSPKLRPGKVKEPSLANEIEQGALKWAVNEGFSEKLSKLAHQVGYV